jgi:hypothetical protein
MALRPADLPSMGGEAVEVAEPAPRPAVAAGSPVPPAPAAEPASVAGPAVAVAAASAARPRLRVTNWWTGAYVVDGEAEESDASFREHASALRWESNDLKRRVRQGTIGARKAAREQIKTARTRARELRRRATTHRQRAVAERQPSLALVAAIVAFLAIGGLITLAFLVVTQNRRSTHFAFAASPAPPAPSVTVETVGDALERLMLVVDAPNRHDVPVTGRIKQLMTTYRNDGVELLLPSSDDAHDRYAALVRDWQDTGAGGPTADAMGSLFAELDLEGLLYVTPELDDTGELALRETYIEAKDADAVATVADIESLLAALRGPQTSLLLINDHPARLDPLVKARIDRIVAEHEQSGAKVIVDDEAEASIRPLLPTWPADDGDVKLPLRFDHVISELEFDGVLWISASRGEGAAHDRVVVKRIDADAAATAETP